MCSNEICDKQHYTIVRELMQKNQYVTHMVMPIKWILSTYNWLYKNFSYQLLDSKQKDIWNARKRTLRKTISFFLLLVRWKNLRNFMLRTTRKVAICCNIYTNTLLLPTWILENPKMVHEIHNYGTIMGRRV